MNSVLFPDSAITILRRAVWQPDAERSYELTTGSFWWSDELVHEVAHLCSQERNWSYRYLMGYRASLIREAPDERCRPVWEQITRECPNWPGLRPERSSPALVGELLRAGRRQCAELARLDKQFRAKNAVPKPSAPRLS